MVGRRSDHGEGVWGYERGGEWWYEGVELTMCRVDVVV